MDVRNFCRTVSAVLLLAGLTGCGHYTVTFEVAEVINAPGDDITREMLDVDIVCLTRQEAKSHPEMVNRTMRANEWFAARDNDDPRFTDIDPRHIYALRRGQAGALRDTLKGEPLLSACDSGKRRVVVQIKHPQALNGEAAIVVYGRFSDGTAVARTEPLVIKPPPRWKEDIFVKVGRTRMELAKID